MCCCCCFDSTLRCWAHCSVVLHSSSHASLWHWSQHCRGSFRWRQSICQLWLVWVQRKYVVCENEAQAIALGLYMLDAFSRLLPHGRGGGVDLRQKHQVCSCVPSRLHAPSQICGFEAWKDFEEHPWLTGMGSGRRRRRLRASKAQSDATGRSDGVRHSGTPQHPTPQHRKEPDVVTSVYSHTVQVRFGREIQHSVADGKLRCLGGVEVVR